MPGLKSESKSELEPKTTGASRRGRRRAQNIRDRGSMRAIFDQRNRLYKEARLNPDSEAGEMVQMYLLTGMMAEASGASRARPAGQRPKAELERVVREQANRLDEVAQAAEQAKAEQWDEMAIYNRIAEIVGLRARAPLQVSQAPQEQDQQVSNEQSEDICQTQPSQNPKS